jgi:hypothetical protein
VLGACSPATLGSLPIEESTTKGEDPETSGDGDGDGDGVDIKFDTYPGGGCGGDGACPNKVDLLFVIDNSGTMAEEQLTLAKNFPTLIQELQKLKNEEGDPVGADVNLMITTTDFGHPLCANFANHPPEQGEPIYTTCKDRIDRFVPIDGGPAVYEACLDVCDDPKLAPEDHFIHFDTRTGEDNVPNVPPKDINGDGEDDDAIAQTLACVAPQGVDGCGYEAPLENMMQAINPTAWWNSGELGQRPFLRHDAILAIAIITDEADCSVKDYEVFAADGMYGTDYWNDRPGMGKAASSAICWNAGVICEGPDQFGEYDNCESNPAPHLQPVDRYIDHLVQNVRAEQGKEVVMLGVLGVPSEDDGGVDALVYRDWEDGEYPNGDILPEDWPEEPADYKQWLFGIGPGCTAYDDDLDRGGQGIPPVRIREVCEALDYDDEVRCCMQSICGTDFRPALKCLTDIIQDAIPVK